MKIAMSSYDLNFLARCKGIEWTPQAYSDFRKRCASALAHPATIASLAILLLNDVAFKAMWPDSWVTGKLSDLAWMVFAPPLLAFLLSFPAGRSAFGQRATVFISFVALPLLYAAYNSFETLHNVILQGLSIASGGVAGSPLDVTDSLVIPFGVGIALWVWRLDAPNTDSLRLRCGLLVAGVAALASVATSYPERDFGIVDLGISENGTIHSGQGIHGGRSQYRSSDGGLSWASSSGDPGQIEWGEASVQTPRGMYVIQGPDIVMVDADGLPQVAYSTAFMQENRNVWAQEHATTRLDARKITTMPLSIVYDERSGNLIAAMGIQGVVVGAPDGVWTPYAVGRSSPVDFSFSGKTSLLLSNGVFWAMAVALSVSMCGIVLVASRYRRSEMPVLAGTVLIALALLVGLPALLVATGQESILDRIVNLFGGASSPAVLLVLLVGGVIGISFLPKESALRKNAVLVLGILALLASGALVFVFGGSNADPTSIYPLGAIVLAIAAYVLGLSVLAISRRELRRWRPVIPTFLGMILLIVLTFMMWLHLDIPMTLAKASAIALVCLAAVVLFGYIKGNEETS